MILKSEFLNVALHVLSEKKHAMRASEIVDEGIKQGLFSDKIAGKTPHQTMKAKLSVYIKKNPDTSIFVRSMPGKFNLREYVNTKDIFKATPILKPKSKEKVLVFNNQWFYSNTRFQGITTTWKAYLQKLIRHGNCRYMSRMDAETNNNNKQILTYVLVTRNQSVLCYKRGNYNRVEDFLRGSFCIGFGGHVIDADADLFSASDYGIHNSIVRELSEELQLPDKDKKRLRKGIGLAVVGLLNDDSSIVGERHFALVYKYEVSDDPAWDKPERGEKSIAQLRWFNPGSDIAPIWNFEYWSQLCLRQYMPWLVVQTAAYRIRRRKIMEPPHLLCVLGEVSSGKSMATSILAKKYGYLEINSGKILAQILGLPPVPITPRAEFQEAAWRYISTKEGPEGLALALLEAAKQTPSQKILIDGIRQRDTLLALKQLAIHTKVAVMFVHTTPDLAFEFYRKREAHLTVDIFDFLAIRNAYVENEVRGLISLSDVILYNWAGENLFQGLVHQVMSVIGGTTE